MFDGVFVGAGEVIVVLEGAVRDGWIDGQARRGGGGSRGLR